jgi:hypothetical protein
VTKAHAQVGCGDDVREVSTLAIRLGQGGVPAGETGFGPVPDSRTLI